MNAFMIGLFHVSAEVLWALVGKLVTRAFLDKLLTKLVVAGLEKLAASTANTLDDSVVADVKSALASAPTTPGGV